jgi:hypothetical protein
MDITERVSVRANGFQMARPKLRQAVVRKVVNVRTPETAESFLVGWLSNSERGVCPMKLMLNSCTEATMNSFEKFRFMSLPLSST